MILKAATISEYLNEITEDQKDAITLIRSVIIENLPHVFEEQMRYGMISYAIPFLTYPSGYHRDSKLPFPFMPFANQKNSINFYHIGISVDSELQKWFVENYSKFSSKKLDMKKSCFRFKKKKQVPFELIRELAGKIKVSDWISTYKTVYKKQRTIVHTINKT
jgi:hypothetical protein